MAVLPNWKANATDEEVSVWFWQKSQLANWISLMDSLKGGSHLTSTCPFTLTECILWVENYMDLYIGLSEAFDNFSLVLTFQCLLLIKKQNPIFRIKRPTKKNNNFMFSWLPVFSHMKWRVKEMLCLLN